MISPVDQGLRTQKYLSLRILVLFFIFPTLKIQVLTTVSIFSMFSPQEPGMVSGSRLVAMGHNEVKQDERTG